MILRYAHELGYSLICIKVSVLAVYRHKILRLQECHKELYLLGAGVPRNMHLLNRVVDYLYAVSYKGIHYLSDELFISGNRARGQDDDVGGGELYLIMLGEGYPVKG